MKPAGHFDVIAPNSMCIYIYIHIRVYIYIHTCLTLGFFGAGWCLWLWTNSANVWRAKSTCQTAINGLTSNVTLAARLPEVAEKWICSKLLEAQLCAITLVRICEN